MPDMGRGVGVRRAALCVLVAVVACLAFAPVALALATSAFRVLVEPSATYEQVYGFVGDYCMVQDPSSHKWGLVGSDGKLLGDGYVYGTGYEAADGVDNESTVYFRSDIGCYVVCDSSQSSSSVEIVAKDGAVVVPEGRYAQCQYAGDGTIPVRSATTNKWGYIDSTGKEIIACQYDWVGQFSNGYAEVTVTNSSGTRVKGLIDESGATTEAPGTYVDFGFCSEEGMISYEDSNNKWGYLKLSDEGASVAISAQYSTAHAFTDGIALVKDGSTMYSGWKAIDTTGKTAYSLPDGEAPLDNNSNPSEGYLAVGVYEEQTTTVNTIWSLKCAKFLDAKTGEVAFGGKTFGYASPFSDGLANVCVGEGDVFWKRQGFIDKSGKLYGGSWSSVSLNEANATGLVAVADAGGNFGVVDTKGNEILPCSFKYCRIYDNGTIVATNTDETVDVYDASGNKLTSSSYQAIGGSSIWENFSFDSDCYAIEQDGKWGVGKVVPASAPLAPQDLVATGDDGRISLAWSAPSWNGGRVITGYDVYLDGTKIDTTTADVTSYTVSGLTNGTTYSCSVKAVNDRGESDAATVSAAPPKASRLWGQGALDTMESIVDEGFTTTGGAVVLATGNGYWDALAASGVAGIVDAPVLMTSLDGTTLSEQTTRELKRLKPTTVYVCGGTAVVSPQVMDLIRSVTGVSPQRLAGDDAPGTAVAIFESKRNEWSKTAIIATCQSFMDALSIAPYAYASKSPLFLTQAGDNALSDKTLAAIEEGGFDRVVIVGGTAVVSSSVEGQLKNIGLGEGDVIRLAGPGCGDTSLKIAMWEIENESMGVSRLGVATDGVMEFVANGRGYWDSLCGAALCGRNKCVLVIGREGSTTAIDGVLDKYGTQVTSVRVFGGAAAVPNSILSRVLSKVE